MTRRDPKCATCGDTVATDAEPYCRACDASAARWEAYRREHGPTPRARWTLYAGFTAALAARLAVEAARAALRALWGRR